MSYLMNAYTGGVQLYTSRRLGNLTRVFTVKVIFPFKIKLCFESDVYFLSDHERIFPISDGYKVQFFFIFLYKIFFRAAGSGKSHMENIIHF